MTSSTSRAKPLVLALLQHATSERATSPRSAQWLKLGTNAGAIPLRFELPVPNQILFNQSTVKVRVARYVAALV